MVRVCAIALLAMLLPWVDCLTYVSIVVKWPRPFLTSSECSVVWNLSLELYVKKHLLEQSDAHRRSGLVLRIVLRLDVRLRVLVLRTRLVKRLLRLDVCTLRV